MARILFVNLEGKIGGAETSLLLTVKYLRGQFAISVACPDGGPLSSALASMQVKSHELPRPLNRSYLSFPALAYWLRVSWRLMRITLRVNPDVIHANNVLAHVEDTNGFVKGIKILLKKNGIAVIEVPYVKSLIDNCEFVL